MVVNCALQDPNAPLLDLCESDLPSFRPGGLIVDVSCDEGTGFSWARDTTFEAPMIALDHDIHYEAVDHSPSYL